MLMADRTGLTKQRRALTKMWLSARWPVITIAVVIVLASVGSTVHDKFKEAQQKSHEQAAKQAVDRVSKGVASELSKALKALTKTLDEPALVRALRSGDQQTLDAQAEQIAASSNSIRAAITLPAGYDTVNRDVSPPIGYAVLKLIERSESQQDQPPPEVHSFKDDNRHIAWLVRVHDGDELVGHVRIALEFSLIKKITEGLDVASGYAELTQPLNKGKPLVLASFGDKSSKTGPASVSKKVKGTGWKVSFWTAASATLASEGTGVIMKAAAGIVVIVLLVAVVMVRKKCGSAAAEAPEPAPAAVVSAPTAVDDDLDPLDIETLPLPQVEGDGLYADLGDADLSVSAGSGDTPPASDGVAAEIFRAYDIRGIVGKSLTPESVTLIGKALGSEAYDRGQQTIVVGYDGRLSGPELAGALSEGLRATGRDVIDIGRVPTPVLYFATHYLNTGSGVVVTGSHNPPDYNGLKIMLGGETLFGDAIQGLRERIEESRFEVGQGSSQSMDVLPEYIRRVTEDVPVALGNSYKVVIDCGNGVAGDVAPKLIRALGHDVIELFCEVDGNFPNHHPDPSKPDNLVGLITAVKENQADLGFAFDGDGDRLGVVDANGEVLWPDLQMMLYSKDILSRNPGAQIVYDVKCTNKLAKVIKKLGGEPLMWKTGHSFIKNKMRETGALLAGEMSGHIFFKERWYGFDDAMYTSARLLELLLGYNRTPTEIFAKLPTGMTTPELNLDMEEGQPHSFVESLVAGASFEGGTISTVDGLRVDYSDGWGLVRASNTTPCLVLRFEADNQEALDRIQGEIRDALLAQDSNLSLPF